MAIELTGLSSGIDSASIIAKLIEVERKPIELLTTQKEKLVEKNTAFFQLNSLLQTLESAANAIDTSDEFLRKTGTFTGTGGTSDSAVEVVASSSVQEGAVNLTITQLAKVQRSVSDFASGTISGGNTGVFSITANGQTAFFSVTSGTSLQDVADDVNNSGLNVTASVLNLGTSANPDFRLVIEGQSTGEDNAFTITQEESTFTGLTFTTTQQAQNAILTVDGVTVERSSNQFDDVVQGATITLKGTGTGTLTFERDEDAIFDQIQTFVDAYNGVMAFIEEQFEFDESTNTTGTLFGNASVRTIQQQLRSIVSSPIPGLSVTNSSIFSSLSQVGIKTNSGGQLEINEATLRDAIQSNLTGVANLFVPSGASSASATVTFIDATGKTLAGTHSFRINNGILELFDPVTGAFVPLDQDGNFFSGPTGSSFEGLLVRVGSIAEGSTGSLTISLGVAERVSFNSGFYTEFSSSGLIFNERSSLETRIDDIDDQISALDERILKKEETLKAQFVNLEVLLSRLKAQENFLTGQLENLGNVFNTQR